MKRSIISLCFIICFLGGKSQIITHLLITFENNGNYAVINTQQPDNLWQKGKPSKVFFDSAYSAPDAIVTDTIHPYIANNISSFTITIRYTGCWGSAFLSFMHKYQTDSLHAGCFVEVAYDTAKTFYNIIYDTVQVLNHMLYPTNFYSKSDTMIGGIPVFQGNSGNWVYSSVYWIWEMGVKSELHDSLTLKFNFKSNADAIPEEGWMVDNIDFTLYDCTGGVAEISSHPSAEIIPNPIHKNATLHLSDIGKGTCRLIIFNSMGIRVKEEIITSYPDYPFNAGTLTPGIYFYRIEGGLEKPLVGKFVIE